MIYVRFEELKVVKSNLVIFSGQLKRDFIDKLLKPKDIRYKKHGLFFSLCNPSVFPFLNQALISIKQYDNGKYFSKAIKKLVKASDWLEHKSVVSEVIVVGYYFKKFKDDKNINVVWERKTAESGRNVDVSILGWKNNVNIEITALHSDAESRSFFQLREEVKIALEQMAESFKEQKYSYLFSLPEGSRLSKEEIHSLVKFIRTVRKEKGVGKHSFKEGEKFLASVDILPLNKLKKEYASNMDMLSGWNGDWERVQDKISGKVSKQLPKGEINFVCISALDIWTDGYEAECAMLGSEKININLKTGEQGWFRNSDDVSKILSKEAYESFYGLIYFNYDYSKKRIIGNPTKKYEGEIKEVVELIN